MLPPRLWISHVPDERSDSFWSLVADALQPDGRVCFFDDNHRPESELGWRVDVTATSGPFYWRTGTRA